MRTNAKALADEMRRDIQNSTGPLGKALDAIHKAVALFLYEALLRNTPVKTGKLVGGWTFNRLGTGGRTNRFRVLPPSETALAELFPVGAEITIRNNVEYVRTRNNANKGNFIELSFAGLISYAKRSGITVRL